MLANVRLSQNGSVGKSNVLHPKETIEKLSKKENLKVMLKQTSPDDYHRFDAILMVDATFDAQAFFKCCYRIYAIPRKDAGNYYIG